MRYIFNVLELFIAATPNGGIGALPQYWCSATFVKGEQLIVIEVVNESSTLYTYAYRNRAWVLVHTIACHYSLLFQ